MPAGAAAFRAWEVGVSGGLALLVQGGWIALLSASSPPAVQADISDEATRPMAVAITPVPLLKAGSPHPAELPKSWRRHPTVAPKPTGALPSPAAEHSPEAIPRSPVHDAAVRPTASAVETDAAPPPPDPEAPVSAASTDAAPVGSAASALGSPEGSDAGTETDPLKARAVSMYRAQLAAWFLSRFAIRGKVPFETLKDLRAAASVSVTGDRRVGGFSITRASGNEVFDGEVRAALSRVQSSGAELPAPPPLYPDVLGQSISVSFQCTSRSQCE
jgi:hypothetical protein